MVYRTVKQRVRRSDKWQQRSVYMIDQANDDNKNNAVIATCGEQSMNKRTSWYSFRLSTTSNSATLTESASNKVDTVATQAVLYSISYLNSFIWPFLVFGINEAIGDSRGREGEPGLYTLQYLAWLLLPLQGFFNLLVYIRP